MSAPDRVLLLGYGALLQNLLPCLKELCPHAQLHAVKGSTCGLDALAAVTPFPISVNDGLAALEELRPELILFAPPPNRVELLARRDLAPYYAQLRQEGAPLPLLLSFPPRPLPSHLHALIGLDVPIATLLPGAHQKAGKLNVGYYGASLACGGPPLNAEHRAMILTFTRPVGMPLWLREEQIMPALAAMVTTYLLGSLRTLWKPEMLREGLSLPDMPGLPAMQSDIRALEAARAFMAGVEDFCRAQSLPEMALLDFLRVTAQTVLCAAQAESEEALQRHQKACATPGGMLARGLDVFSTVSWTDPLSLRQGTYHTACAILERGNSL